MLKIYDFGFLEKSKITESIGDWLFMKPTSEQTFRFAIEMSDGQDLLSNLILALKISFELVILGKLNGLQLFSS